MKERLETLLCDTGQICGEQINLAVRVRDSMEIAGAAVVRLQGDEAVIVDFYVLEAFRRRGAGSRLMEAIERLAEENRAERIGTGKSVHADNREMVAFLEKTGFQITPPEIQYFSQPLNPLERKIHRIASLGYTRFLPERNRLIPFSDAFFEPVHEMAIERFRDHPFFTEPLLYQILLCSSERYSRLLVEENQVNGFALFSATESRIHLNLVAFRKDFLFLGLPVILIGNALGLALKDGKSIFSYIAFRTEELAAHIRSIFSAPDFVVLRMEKQL